MIRGIAIHSLLTLGLAMFGGAIALAQQSANAITEEMLKIRDPFKRPEIKRVYVAPASPLETFPIEQLKMVGVLTGPERLRAMVLGPDGKTYFVTEKMKVGNKGGLVRKITPDAVFVREKFLNLLGREEFYDFQISFTKSGAVESANAGGK